MKLNIDGYLTQQKLSNSISLMCSWCNIEFLGNELKIVNSRRRFDCGFKFGSQLYFIEFDGFKHYTDALQIKIDREKDKLCFDNNIILIRIPYWIQLTNETLRYYFKSKFATQFIFNGVDIIQDYKHGFIDSKCILPASFCELGINRFKEEFLELPNVIKNEICNSIQEKILEMKDIQYVIPNILNGYLNKKGYYF